LQRLDTRPSGYVFFIDDNFAAKPEETKQLLRLMIEKKLNREVSLCQLCVSAAFDEELLYLLKEARVTIVFVGIESISDETLKSLNKKVDAKRNKTAVKLFREAGIWVHGMMMIGGDGDSEKSLLETAQWAQHNLDSVQYFTPTPLVGTKFREDMKKAGRVLTEDYYLYDGQHVVLQPKNFTPYRLQQTIVNMYKEFYCFKESIRTSLQWACSLNWLFIWRKVLLYFYVKKTLKTALKNPQVSTYLAWLHNVGR
jgi:radical SAM superfamily enzyme YgiQ (UPF0313 family)